VNLRDAPADYGTGVRLATWNVNSIRQRVARLLPWLDERRPDVVCLQETKCAEEVFGELLGEELRARGYEAVVHGENSWNGVAILSRVGLEEVTIGLPGGPGMDRRTDLTPASRHDPPPEAGNSGFAA